MNFGSLENHIMKPEQTHNNSQHPICIGTGLVALDVVISGNPDVVPTQFFAGGSCGNVLTILSYLGWTTYPIARLSDNMATELLLQDLEKWNVKDDLLTFTKDGSTPIIIHRILKDKHGAPKHRFEFRNPEDGSYLPAYKPCLAKSVIEIVEKSATPKLFYFDRINRASIELAKAYKGAGTIIYFEPSSAKDLKGFKECLEIADILKFSDDRIPDYDHLYPAAQASIEIQTLGERGLKFRRRGECSWNQLPSYSIDNVVDSAGAGDWCTAGIIMNLFKTHSKLSEVKDSELTYALRFGQALSALNCTFEGARGLMYNINRHDLLLSVQHFVNSAALKIPQRSKAAISYQSNVKQLKIASLFMAS